MLRATLSFAVLVLGAISISSSAQDPSTLVLPDSIEWRPAPPKLPPGAQIAVAFGDRTKPGVPHYNRMRGETILQFHGIGPYDIDYVDPADDPSRQ